MCVSLFEVSNGHFSIISCHSRISYQRLEQPNNVGITITCFQISPLVRLSHQTSPMHAMGYYILVNITFPLWLNFASLLIMIYICLAYSSSRCKDNISIWKTFLLHAKSKCEWVQQPYISWARTSLCAWLPGAAWERANCAIVSGHHGPDSKVHEANMGLSGADRTQVGSILVPWTLLSGGVHDHQPRTDIDTLVTE